MSPPTSMKWFAQSLELYTLGLLQVGHRTPPSGEVNVVPNVESPHGFTGESILGYPQTIVSHVLLAVLHDKSANFCDFESGSYRFALGCHSRNKWHHPCFPLSKVENDEVQWHHTRPLQYSCDGRHVKTSCNNYITLFNKRKAL